MERTWFVTGSSAGFGRALARAALAAGDRVVATARHVEALDDLITIAPDRALAVSLDVTDRAQVHAAMTSATDRFGAIDVLDKQQHRELMDTMYFAPVALIQKCSRRCELGAPARSCRCHRWAVRSRCPALVPIVLPSSDSRP